MALLNTHFPVRILYMSDLYDDLGSTDGKNLQLDANAIAGLKKMPVDLFEGRYLGEACNSCLTLCVDVRGFSNFLRVQPEETVYKLITEFTSNLLACINQFGYGCSYYKLMGDGAIVIWDKATKELVEEAILIFDTYTDFLNEDLFQPFPDLGMAGALVLEKNFKYEISAEVSQLKYRDYVGYGINLACRLQGMAPKNELILNKMLAKTGTIPFRASNSPDTLKELQRLKGLKEDDRNQILFYDKTKR